MAGALSFMVAVAVAVAPLLLAGVARADCFDYCFKNCIANDKSMTDYCNYACDKTCDPGAPQRPAAGSDIGCQLSCARTSCNDCEAVETCFGRCYDGCKTKPLPRPLRAGASVLTASGPVFPSSEPDPDDAATEKHPFHEKQDGVGPSSEALDPDGAGHPGKASSSLNCNFHEKQDSVQPASEQKRTPLSEIHAAPPAPL